MNQKNQTGSALDRVAVMTALARLSENCRRYAMIIKIHNRGAGCGSGPVNYLLGKDRDREDARLDRGNPDQMIELIDSTNYAQRYKSGVFILCRT